MYCCFRKRYSHTKEQENSGLQLNTATFQDIKQLLERKKKKKKKPKSTMYHMILGNIAKRLKMNITVQRATKKPSKNIA